MPKVNPPNKEAALSLRQLREALEILFAFNKYILRYWKFEIALFVLGNFSVFLALINPYLAKLILDRGILGKDAVLFIKLTVVAGVIFVFRWAFEKANVYLSGYIERKVKVDLSKGLFEKINKLSLRFFQERSTGELIFRINTDIFSSTQVITSVLPDLILSALRLIYISIIILFINYKIIFLVLAYQSLLALRAAFFIKRIQETNRANIAKSQNLFGVLSDFFSHIYFVKAAGSGYALVRRYFKGLFENIRVEIKVKRIALALEGVTTFSDRIFFGLVGLFGSLMVIQGNITLGGLGAILAYLHQGISAYTTIFNSAKTIILSRIPLERLNELLDADIEVKEKKDAKAATFLRGEIKFKDVSFGYTKQRYILEGISFNIPAEGKAAIVGESGVGKSTVINLLLRLFDLRQGAILIDGYDLRDLKFKSLYSQIGIALQEPFLFNESVRGNICFGQRRLGSEEIISAAKVACAHEFISGLPQGYDTVIGENACKISQGQKQRIAISRAVSKKPKILILDEAMSSLDSQTEDQIVQNLKAEFIHSTLIIVSHRLATARKMDLVYFLESPARIEVGRHAELLERNLNYRELFASQIKAERYPDGARVV
jgi:ABC-type bacteriocin/lantibiotic exporter with double-glycine peptidase domain